LSQLESRATDDARLALGVNNAGFGGYRPFVEVEPKVIDELIGVHVRAVAWLTRAALPGMVRRCKGAVVNVASILALSGALPPNPARSCASQVSMMQHCSNALPTPAHGDDQRRQAGPRATLSIACELNCRLRQSGGGGTG
jgi:short-subunit dehydrogenase